MGGCSAVHCTNHSRKKHRMFKFPKDPVRRAIWTIKCRRNGWVPGPNAQLCSEHFEENQFEQHRADNWKKLKQTAIPTLFNIPNLPLIRDPMLDKSIGRPTPGTLLQTETNYKQSLKMDDSLIPGNAYIVRVVPATSENIQPVNQEIKFDDESVLVNQEIEFDYERGEEEINDVSGDTDDDGADEVSEEESDPCLSEENPEKTPETEVVTYLVCDNNNLANIQKFIPGLPQDNSIALTKNFHSKEVSKISDIIQATPVMSKVIELKARDKLKEIDELKEKTDTLYKIAILERKLERFRNQRKIDKSRIKTLLQSQRRNIKKIFELKKSITNLKQQKYTARAGSEYIRTFSLLDLLDTQKYQSKDQTAPKEYSSEARKFAKALYTISREAYRYVRNYFDMLLPHERTISKWITKEKRNLNFINEELNFLNSSFNSADMEA